MKNAKIYNIIQDLVTTGGFEAALNELQKIRTTELTFDEKRNLIHSFDAFLEGLHNEGKSPPPTELKILAEIKRILISYQFETSSYDKEKLRALLRMTLINDRPLSILLIKPFAFCLDNVQINPSQVLEL